MRMSDAYIETTVLTDLLLKPRSRKQQRAKAALKRYQDTLLPVYSIKEWKAGPLDKFAHLHDKLVVTKSYRDTFQTVSEWSGYLKSTAMEGLAAALQLSKNKARTDEEMADSCRLALVSLIMRSWRKRRHMTTRVVDELACYVEVEPRVGRDGLLDLAPQACESDHECCLAPRLKAQPKLLESMRNAIPPTSGKKEHQKRREALRQLIKHPNTPLSREACRHLGDAVFAFFCPQGAVVLTTNVADHEPLAKSIGKIVEKP